ncbi:MAG: hemolysin family protein [Lachnospiraceae bacterium]|nr:hemolysin family protein [Lachnospiraceae bacterium]
MEEQAGSSLGGRLRRRLLKKREEEKKDEEILSIVKDYQEQGALLEEEAEMISNIMEFSDTQTGDIMTNRTRIDAISCEETLENALLHMLHGNFSRYPLYRETLDDIVGMLYLKDVMVEYMEGERNCPLERIAREPMRVPETLPIDTLFADMQAKKMQLAVVIDEYGQTAGIVSMEDVLEEIVGDIMDEYDQEEKEAENTGKELIVSGRIPLEELHELISVAYEEEDEENFDTLNGLLIAKLGHIPEDGEQAVIEYQGYRFVILNCENRMIDRVRIEKI